MSTILSSGATTIAPAAVFDYATSQDAQNIIHDILGRTTGVPDVTLRAALSRAGVLHLVFATPTLAAAARAALAATVATWQLASSEVPAVNMSFVLQGTLGTVRQSAGEWTLDVGYREV